VASTERVLGVAREYKLQHELYALLLSGAPSWTALSWKLLAQLGLSRRRPTWAGQKSAVRGGSGDGIAAELDHAAGTANACHAIGDLHYVHGDYAAARN